jgi:DNA polymerase-3 subunit delta'
MSEPLPGLWRAHAGPRAAFEAAWASGRMHHAWLLAGPDGVGKRGFALAAARMALSGATSMDVPDDHPAARLLSAGSHPDFRLLEPGLTARGDRRSAVIAIDDVRAMQSVLHLAPSLAAWRVVVIDPADAIQPPDGGRAPTANALLKSLEEPPANTLFLLVSHAPGRLLPTIRSRCRRLVFRPLAEDATRAALAGAMPAADHAELDRLTALSEGAPGRALRYAGLEAGALSDALTMIAGAPADTARATALALAKQLAGRQAQARYEAFLDLAPRHLAAVARTRGGDALDACLALWEEARDLGRDGPALDPAATVAELCRLVALAGPPAGPSPP